jgi:hypothetical protein
MRTPSLIAIGLLSVLAGCNTSSSSSGAAASAPAQNGAGALAAQTVSAGPGHDALVVYVDWVEGQQPGVETLDLLERRLSERCQKPGGVHVLYGGALQGVRKGVYEEADLQALARTAPPREPLGGEAVELQVIFVDGAGAVTEHEDDRLGLAISPSQVAVFAETVAAHAPSAERLGAAVALHELGHLMGLVNLGAPLSAPHADPLNLAHCQNNGCLMTARSNNWGLRRDVEPDFCADCKADLQALGGR